MTEGNDMLKTALHDRHVAMEATMGTEAGWSVPLSYTGALEEAAEVRRHAGIFDVSHMGRIRIRGDGALDLLSRACSADVYHQEDDTTIPTVLCNEQGGILDLCRLIRLPRFHVLVTSGHCREKILAHLTAMAGDFDAKVDDQTPKTSLLEVSGPATAEILNAVLPFHVGDLAKGEVKFGSLMIAKYIAERTSCTGEWGVAVAIPNLVVGQAWRFITHKAGEHAVMPCGLAARDVLRIEAARPRYGHELNETIAPATAGLEACVDFGHDFLGADAVKQAQERPVDRKLIGLILKAPPGDASGSVVAGQGATICRPGGEEIGVVTSGTYSPALQAAIAMGYVTAGAVEPGDEVAVTIAEATVAAEVATLPFVAPKQ